MLFVIQYEGTIALTIWPVNADIGVRAAEPFRRRGLGYPKRARFDPCHFDRITGWPTGPAGVMFCRITGARR